MTNANLHVASQTFWLNKQDALHRHSDEWWLRRYADELLAFLPHGGTLLDVGCGAGQVTTYLAAAYDRVLGIDFSDSMLEAARRRIAEIGLSRIAVAKGDATRFPPEAAAVNVIVAFGVIQYLDESALATFLAECDRVLEPGGVVCLGLVPDTRYRRLWYSGALATRRPRLRGMFRLLLQTEYRWRRARAKGDHLWDGIGRWFEREELGAACAAAGFTAEFRHCWYYEYRFHALLSRRDVKDV